MNTSLIVPTLTETPILTEMTAEDRAAQLPMVPDAILIRYAKEIKNCYRKNWANTWGAGNWRPGNRKGLFVIADGAYGRIELTFTVNTWTDGGDAARRVALECSIIREGEAKATAFEVLDVHVVRGKGDGADRALADEMERIAARAANVFGLTAPKFRSQLTKVPAPKITSAAKKVR